jgi:hypothetical protein
MKCKDMLVRRGYIIPRSCSREHTPRRPRSYVREDSEHTSILAKRGYTSILVRREYTSILVRRGYTSILVRRGYTCDLDPKSEEDSGNTSTLVRRGHTSILWPHGENISAHRASKV